MAPSGPPAKKEDPKAKAESKAKPKAKKEKVEEEEKPKLPQPDRAVHDEKIAGVNGKIEKLQKQLKELSGKIGERSTGKEEFFQKKAELRQQLDEFSGKMNAIQEQKDGIKKAVGEKQAEGKEMKQKLNGMKKNLGFTSEDQIDDRIATIEYKMWTGSVSLKEEKAFLKEISELKKNKPKISQLNQMEASVSSFDGGVPMKEQMGSFNEQMAILREQKKAVSEKYSALMEERSKQMGDMPELFEAREALNKQIGELIKERNELRDEFRAAEREYNAYLQEQRAARADKQRAEREVRQKEWDVARRQKEADKLEEQPFVSETTLIEQTIKWCKSLLPKDAEATKEEKKDIVHTNKDDELVVLKKSDREEEFFFAPTKKAKGAKNKSKKETTAIKHNVETFKLFSELKLDAPITTDEIPPIVEKLEAQLETYQAKIALWVEKREEMKKKILEGADPEEAIAEAKEDGDEKAEEAKEEGAES